VVLAVGLYSSNCWVGVWGGEAVPCSVPHHSQVDMGLGPKVPLWAHEPPIMSASGALFMSHFAFRCIELGHVLCCLAFVLPTLLPLPLLAVRFRQG
jgi:hypothetical protein